MKTEDGSNLVHVEFPQHQPENDGPNDVERIENESALLDELVKNHLRITGNELGMRRITRIEDGPVD